MRNNQHNLSKKEQSVLNAINKMSKKTWIPSVLSDGSPQTSSHNGISQYFGNPSLPKAMEWPHSGNMAMNFVLQLDIASLPKAFLSQWNTPQWWKERGLLLFFYADKDHDKSFITVVDKHATEKGDLPESVVVNQALPIQDWVETIDYPWVEEFYSNEDLPGLDNVDSEDISMLYENLGSSTFGYFKSSLGKEHLEKDVLNGVHPFLHCFECDKLWGWPRWEQGKDIPLDKKGLPMQFILQVGYEGLHLDNKRSFKWPTWGRGQIFYSENTKEFEYVWACD